MALRAVAGEDRGRTVLIRADARTPWQAVVTTYEAWANGVSTKSPMPLRRHR